MDTRSLGGAVTFLGEECCSYGFVQNCLHTMCREQRAALRSTEVFAISVCANGSIQNTHYAKSSTS